MKLIEAYNLLVEDGIADNQRYFAELYKHFQFGDQDRLKEYLDFIVQEPVQWIHGFPTKLTTKTSFSKPKTAVIKLLKKEAVLKALGKQYVEQVHDTIWTTYKQHWEDVLKQRERIRPVRVSVLDHFEAESLASQPTPSLPRQLSERELPDTASEPDLHLTFEEEPPEIPSPPPAPTLSPLAPAVPAAPASLAPCSTTSQEQRIQILKDVIQKLSSTLEPSVSDAFCLLLSCV